MSVLRAKSDFDSTGDFMRSFEATIILQHCADFLDLLANADTWTVTDSELVLSGGNAVARFARKGLDGTS